MKAAILLDGKITLEDIPEPTPEHGQILARPLLCGVCGSDLHARDHAVHLCDLLDRAGFRGFMDPARPVVMGHEYCAEILDWGPGCDRRLPRGQRVVALPFVDGPAGIELIGYSNGFNGAFAERMRLQESLLIPVPDHVPTEIAALTEPLAVAVHAVAQSSADRDTVVAVHGCGPVGLFIIARLKALGIGPILAVEPNPTRRQLAAQLGADLAIAPDRDAVRDWWSSQGCPTGVSDAAARPPGGKRAVAFECVGKPGMLTALAESSPVGAIITVAGVCMEPDALEPGLMIQKSLQLRFVFAYSAEEFAEALQMIARDPAALAPLVTGKVGLPQVSQAFDTLIAGGDQVKMLVSPDFR